MNDMTNPKDLHGLKKVQLGLLPAAGIIYGALAMMLGAVKYGPYNWRAKKVRMTIYLDAMERHIIAIREGQWIDPESGKPHIGHIIACGSILADAWEGEFLIDDRPPPGPGVKVLEAHEVKAKSTKPQRNGPDVAHVNWKSCACASCYLKRVVERVPQPASLTEAMRSVAQPRKRRGASGAAPAPRSEQG